MGTSVTSGVTAPDALAHLIERGHEKLLEEAHQTHERYVRAVSARHGRAGEMDYLRGRWHGVAKALAIVGDFPVPAAEADLLDFVEALLSHFER